MAQRDSRANVAFSGCLGGVKRANLVFHRLFTIELSQLNSIFEGEKNCVEPAHLELRKKSADCPAQMSFFHFLPTPCLGLKTSIYTTARILVFRITVKRPQWKSFNKVQPIVFGV